MQTTLGKALKPFAAQDRKTILLHGILEGEDLGEELSGAARCGRVGGEVVADFGDGEVAAQAFVGFVHKGRSVDIFTDAVLMAVMRFMRQALDGGAVKASNGETDIRMLR